MPRRQAARRSSSAACRGAMLLMVMFVVALMGILLAAAGTSWHMASRRDKEAQLLFVGAEFRRALASYRAATPPGMPALPERLDQLVLDNRQQVPLRHLRRIYRDPLTEGTEWGLVREGGRIIGVYSLGGGVPLRQGGFPAWATSFSNAANYAKWRFGDRGAVKEPEVTVPSPLLDNNAQAAASALAPTDEQPKADWCESVKEILQQCDPATSFRDGRCRGALLASRHCK